MRKILGFICFSLMANFSYAAIDCIGKVNKVLIYQSGVVNIKTSWRGDYVHICNLKEERAGVSIATCAMWASMLQNIKKSGGDASFYYNPDSTYDSCSNVPTYSASPAPVYIGDI